MRSGPARPVRACTLRNWCLVSHVTCEAPLHTSHLTVFTLHTTHFTLRSSHCTLRTSHSTLFTLHTALFALHTSVTRSPDETPGTMLGLIVPKPWMKTIYYPSKQNYCEISELFVGHASENCWNALIVLIQEIQEPMDMCQSSRDHST